MQTHRLKITLDVAPRGELELGALIPIFHRWIRERRLDELLIDVADYRHVPGGPGVLLIAHEAHYGVEAVDGRVGLVYACKRAAAGSFAERLRAALDRALLAGRELAGEDALGGLAVPGDRWTLSIPDRLLAPNDDRTRVAVEPALRRLLGRLYGADGFELRAEDDPAACFALTVTAAEAPGVDALRDRLVVC